METGYTPPHGHPYAHARWCGVCDRFHGELYICPKYSVELKIEIWNASEEWKLKLQDPEFVKTMPSEVAAMYKIFAGVD